MKSLKDGLKIEKNKMTEGYYSMWFIYWEGDLVGVVYQFGKNSPYEVNRVFRDENGPCASERIPIKFDRMNGADLSIAAGVILGSVLAGQKSS